MKIINSKSRWKLWDLLEKTKREIMDFSKNANIGYSDRAREEFAKDIISRLLTRMPNGEVDNIMKKWRGAD